MAAWKKATVKPVAATVVRTAEGIGKEEGVRPHGACRPET
jgi:hypothetical protein